MNKFLKKIALALYLCAFPFAVVARAADLCEAHLEQAAIAPPLSTHPAVLQAIALLEENYTGFQKIGEGGLAEVYGATEKTTGRKYALKILKTRRLRHEKNLRAEARIMKELAEFEKESGEKFFPIADLMELSPAGGEIQPVLRIEFIGDHLGSTETVAPTLMEIDMGRLATDPTLRAEIRRQLARAIVRAHALGIVHQDLKPNNIAIQLDSKNKIHLKILDWNLAAYLPDGEHRTGYPEGHEPGNFVGTTFWAAPEQLAMMPASKAFDVNGAIVIDHYMRSGSIDRLNSYSTEAYVYPRSRWNSPAVHRFWRPAIALDTLAPDGRPLDERERLIAMAEFSRWPVTFQQRRKLLTEVSSPHVSVAESLKNHSQRLLSLDEKTIDRSPIRVRLRAADEILRSGFLVENFGEPGRLEFKNKAAMEEIIRGVFVRHQTLPKSTVETGPMDPYPEMLFDGFFKRLTVLHNKGLIGDPRVYEIQATQFLRASTQSRHQK